MTGHVYFARVGDLIKVGYSARLGNRLKQHSNTFKAEGVEVTFLLAFPGGPEAEAAMRQMLSGYQITGRSRRIELFRIPEGVLSGVLDGIKNLHGDTVLYPGAKLPVERAFTARLEDEVVHQLAIIAAETRRTREDLMREWLNWLFKKHGKPEIA